MDISVRLVENTNRSWSWLLCSIFWSFIGVWIFVYQLESSGAGFGLGDGTDLDCPFYSRTHLVLFGGNYFFHGLLPFG